MCYGPQRTFAADLRSGACLSVNAVVVEDLRGRLADTEARLARARARKAELGRRLEEMRRSVSVMKILKSYLKRRFCKQSS